VQEIADKFGVRRRPPRRTHRTDGPDRLTVSLFPSVRDRVHAPFSVLYGLRPDWAFQKSSAGNTARIAVQLTP